MSIIHTRNVSKSYDDIQALDSFSLDVEGGEVVALLGPDGAGKTTFMRIICNLIRPDPRPGTVAVIDGADVLSDFWRVKHAVAYMPQTFSLYPDLSVEENMSFYAGIYGFTGNKYRRMRDRMYEFSGLGPFAGRRAGDLSGGMKQKLALSCSLLHDPHILILDEPTTGVDPLSRRQFWEMLLELKRGGVTILLSTPYMDEVARADRAAAILGGRKLLETSPAEMAAGFEGRIYDLPVEPSIELVDGLSAIEGLTARRFGSRLHLSVSEDDRIENYHEDLRKANIDPGVIEEIEPSIEDRFIQLMEERR